MGPLIWTNKILSKILSYHTMRLETKMQNGNGLVQNLTKKALETNQIASCK